MKIQEKIRPVLIVVLIVSLILPASIPALADGTTQTLPFSQNWTNTGLITADDNWSGVPGMIGYRGDDLTTSTGTDPQTLLMDGTSTPVDVNANQTNPDTFTTGGVVEYAITNPTIALQGSGTGDAPFILITLDTTGQSNIGVSYNLRDLDASVDNAVQPIALHYRVGASGNFTNVPAGYVADATTGPSLATLVTPVSVTLPAAANNQSIVQVRIMTTNAAGNDEGVGIDDISISGIVGGTPTPTETSSGPTSTATETSTPTLTRTATAPASGFGACSDPATPIHDIQGNGTTSPMNGSAGVIIEGVVVGDYQAANQFGGFHIQEEDAQVDADPATSEGIFVFSSSTPVSVGDKVRARGTISEFTSSGITLTELSSVTDVSVCSSGNSVTASVVTLPVSILSDWERYEGMSISIAQQLTVTETFTLSRFGEVALSVGGRLFNPTTLTTPGALAIAQQSLNDRSRILLDDGDNNQNIDPTIHPIGGLSATNTLRSGYTIPSLTGVLEQRFGVYRVQPVGPISFSASNPRPAAPENVGGRLKVAAMNALNFFTTLDNAPDGCGPLGTLECRGANTSQEFTRQRDKILNQMLVLNADVYGLMELENNASDSPLQSQVSGLNAATAPGTYSYIATGVIGGDAIKVGLIYKTVTVAPVGTYALLTSSVDPAFIDTLNRPVLAQTFSEISTGERFTIAVNHLKSKGSACSGDPDTGDGQGNCNLTREAAAQAEVDWLLTDPTSSGDPDFLLVGDFNAYLKEDPITALINAGYTDLIDSFIGADAYSYVFGGQSGYLDHGLANASLAVQVTDITEWHNNADEPVALDYNTEFKTATQINTFYDPAAFRVSDHDSLLIGLNLSTPATATPTTTVTNTATFTPTETITETPTPTTQTPTETGTATLTATATEASTTTPTVTSSVTATLTPTSTRTPTATATRTNTSTATATFTKTATPTITPTPTEAVITLTLKSIPIEDGWILESTETSSTGGTMDNIATTFRLGDEVEDKQYRSILSFNTTLIPDTAVLQSAVLKIKQNGAAVGTDPFTILGSVWADIRTGTFGAGALELADFNSAASVTAAGAFNSTPVSSVYTLTMNSTARNAINKLGRTQIRLRFGIDDNNDSAADYMKFLSGDFTSSQPELVITYIIP